jgi:threonine dehydrogenase-like Zn-dependent dehydrogenase
MVLRSHARALRCLIAPLPPARDVAIVGGGVFPRTALIVRELLPHARITVIDASQENLERARAFLKSDAVTFVHYEYRAPENLEVPYDLIFFPLSFDGDRRAIYDRPPAPFVVVHDWIWRTRGVSCVVSMALLKRVNLVRR